MIYEAVDRWNSPYIEHHGVKGMKWGVRKARETMGRIRARREARSLRGNFHRALAANYNLNAKTYTKLGNRVVASMNSAAAKSELKKAEAADAAKQKKIQEKREFTEKLKKVDPSVAKNKETRRVAYDYHNLSDMQFRGKYQTSKKTFAKRYAKTKGDTFSAGLRGAAIASLIVAGDNGSVPYYDLRTGRVKEIKTGKAAAVKSLATDVAYSEAVTRIGYNRAESTYEQNKRLNDRFKDWYVY